MFSFQHLYFSASFISVIPAMSVFQQMFLFIRKISYCSNFSFSVSRNSFISAFFPQVYYCFANFVISPQIFLVFCTIVLFPQIFSQNFLFPQIYFFAILCISAFLRKIFLFQQIFCAIFLRFF